MANQRIGTGKNGSRKVGRSRVKCAAYKTRRQREKNKIRTIARHLKTHENDLASFARMETFQAFVAGN